MWWDQGWAFQAKAEKVHNLSMCTNPVHDTEKRTIQWESCETGTKKGEWSPVGDFQGEQVLI